MLDTGLSLEYIDNMGLQDVGDVIAYWSGKSKGEERLREKSKKKNSTRVSKKGRRGR